MVPSDELPTIVPSSAGRWARLVPRAFPGRFRVSLQVSLVAVLLGAVAVTGLAVHVPWSYVSQENISDMAAEMNEELINDISRDVADLFRSTEETQQTLYDILSSGIVDANDVDQLNRLCLSFLRGNKTFSWVSYGRPNGDFFGAQRRDDVNYRLVKSIWNPKQNEATRAETYFAFDGEQLNQTRTKVKASDYDATTREWFTLAAAYPGHVWTDVYVFATSGKPGINTAIAYRKGETLEGVISIAIELDRISQHLRELPMLRNGTAFIVDRNGQMVAFKDPGEVVALAADGGDPRRRRLDESWQPQLRTAQRAIAASRTVFYQLAGPRNLVVEGEKSEGRSFVTLAPIGRQNWIVGTVIPESDFTKKIEANRRRLALTVLGAVLLVGCVAIVLSRHLFIKPLDRITGLTREVERFNLASVRLVPTHITEIHDLSAAIHQMSSGLASFRRFLPADLVRSLLSRGVMAVPGGEQRTLSVLFMDLAGFTSATERLGPRIVPMLSDYLGAMSYAIGAEKGTVDKFIGDAVMAFWGAPEYNENHAVDACRAALRCLAVMRELRAAWRTQKRPEFRARIGINTGRVVVGNIGSPDRLNYTVVGDPVNLASRLEGLNKQYGTELLISQTTYELAKYDIVARRLDDVTVKGRDEAVKIYELLAITDDNGEAAGFEWVAVFEAALDRYAAKDWAEAGRGFERVIALRGDDAPSRLYLERLAERRHIEAQLALPRAG
jgi:adenylate cyclase